MKNRTFKLFANSMLIMCMVVIFTACSNKMYFNSSQAVPAADGRVKYKKDNNGNYAIDVKITNLAEAKDLTPPRNTYVLWMETDQSGTQNLGQINSSSGLLSSKLKASLEAVTPFKPRSFFITAEDNPTVNYPGAQVILRTR